MLKPAIEKIFLTEMTNGRSDSHRNADVIVDNQPDSRSFGNGQDFVGHTLHFLHRFALGTKLNKIRTAVTKLLSNQGWWTALEVSRIDERVKSALANGFHGEAFRPFWFWAYWDDEPARVVCSPGFSQSVCHP